MSKKIQVLIVRFKHHNTRLVFSLALLPDGLRFVSGDEKGRACIAYHGLAPR